MINLSLIVLSGFAVARYLRHQSAATRHWVLLATLICAASLPVLERAVPVWQLPAPLSLFTSSFERVNTFAGDTTRAVSARIVAPVGLDQAAAPPITNVAGRMLRLLWIAGLAVNLFVLGVGLCRLLWIISRSERVLTGQWVELTHEVSRALGVRRTTAVLLSEHPSWLVTCGVWRPKIIVPRGAVDWPAERVRAVLGHELSHIRRHDWAAQLGAETFRCLHWFNPLVWFLCRRLREESELACDDAVLGLGIGGASYAQHLVHLAQAARAHRWYEGPLSAPAMVRRSGLERRVNAMLNKNLNRLPPRPAIRAVSALGVVGLSVVLASFGAAAQSFATFSGSVLGPTNGSIPKATLTLTNVGTLAKYEVRSDEAGRFEFVGLPPGDYAVRVQSPGFLALTGTLTVSGQNIQRNLALQVGTLSEYVAVKGGASDPTPPGSVDRPALAKRGVEDCRSSSSGAELRPPRKVKHVNPVYPAYLQQAGVTGDVSLDARIGLDGRIAAVDVVRSPHPDLSAAALDAVRQWDFDPTLLNCAPIEVRMMVTVNFSLK
jgi:TonB family protein